MLVGQARGAALPSAPSLLRVTRASFCYAALLMVLPVTLQLLYPQQGDFPAYTEQQVCLSGEMVWRSEKGQCPDPKDWSCLQSQSRKRQANTVASRQTRLAVADGSGAPRPVCRPSVRLLVPSSELTCSFCSMSNVILVPCCLAAFPASQPSRATPLPRHERPSLPADSPRGRASPLYQVRRTVLSGATHQSLVQGVVQPGGAE